MASDVLLRLAVITGNDDYAIKGATPLRALHDLMGRAPAGTGHWLATLDFYVSVPKEIAIVGARGDPATQRLIDTVFKRYLPNKVVVGTSRGGNPPNPPEIPLNPALSRRSRGRSTKSAQRGDGGISIPLLEGRDMLNGQPTAYVCQNYACRLLVTDPEALAAQLTA